MYATAQQLADIGLNTRALQGIGQTRVQSALQISSDMVSGYLNRRFTMPLSAWGRDITRATCIIAAYDLRVSSGFNPAPGSADEQLQIRYDDTINWLENVAKGIVIPVGVVDSSTNPTTADSSFAIAESDTPRGW